MGVNPPAECITRQRWSEAQSTFVKENFYEQLAVRSARIPGAATDGINPRVDTGATAKYRRAGRSELLPNLSGTKLKRKKKSFDFSHVGLKRGATEGNAVN